MSFPNYQGIPPPQGEENNGQAVPGAPVPQGQIQPIETIGGQFPPPGNPVMSPSGEQPGSDAKTTLW
jgi:hypothetical protein